MLDKNNDEIAIDITKGSFSATGETVKNWSDVFIKCLSPATATLNTIGSLIDCFGNNIVRTYKINNYVKTMKKVQEINKIHKIKIVPPTPKFFLDWVEKCSLEDDGNEDLSDLWAGLLISASQDKVEPCHYIFKRLLSEMTKEHLDLLFKITKTEDFSSVDDNVFSATYNNFNNNFFNKKAIITNQKLTTDNDYQNIIKEFDKSGLYLPQYSYGISNDDSLDFGLQKKQETTSKINAEFQELVKKHTLELFEQYKIIHNGNVEKFIGTQEEIEYSYQKEKENYYKHPNDPAIIEFKNLINNTNNPIPEKEELPIKIQKYKYISVYMIGLTQLGRNFVLACGGQKVLSNGKIM